MLGQEESCWCFIGVLLEAVVMSEMLVDELVLLLLRRGARKTAALCQVVKKDGKEEVLE